MTLPRQFNGIAEAAASVDRPLHLAIGMFDGVHLGHRAVIEPAVEAARASGGMSGVLTFWPHPSAFLRPDHRTHLIQSPDTKAEILARIGVDLIITERFTPEFACIEAEEFLPWLKRHLPALQAVYIGENFRFGRKRRGDAGLLGISGSSMNVAVNRAARLKVHDEPVSSTRIRAHLAAGEIAAANALLGYDYFAEGIVTAGKRLGRTLGFPTLNLVWSPDLKPRFGVYAVRVSGEAEGAVRPGVANYGVRPTVEKSGSEPRLEVHLLANCPFDVGDFIRVEWKQFIRPETKFENLDALRAQIANDCAAAAKILSS